MVPTKADEFKVLLETLASSGAASLTVDDLLERLNEREKIEDLGSITAKRAIFPSLFSS